MNNRFTYLLNATSSTLLTSMNDQFNTVSSKVDDALSRISTVNTKVDDLSSGQKDVSNAIGSLSTYVTAVLAISIINLIVSIALPFVRKK
jgi:outer membrane murein-binding lipoprotein Lpp